MEQVVNASSLDSFPQLPTDSSIERKEEEFKVTVAGKTIGTHVVQMLNSKADVTKGLNVFFLHGGRFSSQDWLNIKTMEHVANWGHRAIAIDLPGKGKTTDKIEEGTNAEYLAAFVTKMAMDKVVIVSPSSSGRYSLPYLFKEPKTSLERAAGFVPVAPSSTHDYRSQYPDSQVPTLIVYGTKDPAGATTLNDLMLLPKHEIAPIEGAGHPCYLDDPDAFHKVLYHFLKKLSS